jgi:hypothetical protein
VKIKKLGSLGVACAAAGALAMTPSAFATSAPADVHPMAFQEASSPWEPGPNGANCRVNALISSVDGSGKVQGRASTECDREVFSHHMIAGLANNATGNVVDITAPNCGMVKMCYSNWGELPVSPGEHCTGISATWSGGSMPNPSTRACITF